VAAAFPVSVALFPVPLGEQGVRPGVSKPPAPRV